MDILIAVDPAANFDRIDLVRVKNLLADSLGRPVDVVDGNSLKPAIREAIRAEIITVV